MKQLNDVLDFPGALQVERASGAAYTWLGRAALIALALAAILMPFCGPSFAQGARPLSGCSVDAVVSGTVCMDKYEASVWRVPGATTFNRALVARIQQGNVAAADLIAGGATQLGLGLSDDYAPCTMSGQTCADDIYAVSVAGIRPSANLTWFQARAACENSRKRLPTNAEWQAAVTGTPDEPLDDDLTSCHIGGTGSTTPSGSRSACKSARGAYDMVGNLFEWVADWVPLSFMCDAWSSTVTSDDDQCLLGASTTDEPGALVRSGSFVNGATAGPLSVNTVEPSLAFFVIGFRCAR